MTFNIGKAKAAAREGIAATEETDKLIDSQARSTALVPVESAPAKPERERLVAADFPFDESQLAAVHGMVASRFACLTGAAGTGKTTVTKKFVDELLDSTTLAQVDLSQYWNRDTTPADDEDDYTYDESNPLTPAIALCAYTGRATQQIKRNFPTGWHSNIMTIHRMLGFMPETYEDWDAESGEYKSKMRFVPTYNASLKMPWDIVIIDEAGMLGLDLWHQLLDACKPTTRIYMIGDINQLPPIYGKSIFGFAMARWPTFELTKVHRQQGVNNPIVDNAWRVIHGIMPETEGKFKMTPLPVDSLKASSLTRGIARKLKGLGVYQPLRDVIITPIHGINPGPGSALGDYPLNEQLSMMFNSEPENPRYVIDGGRERKLFAVGDKVMATKNDWVSGITNGMTGHIVDILENETYGGNRHHYGKLADVNARFSGSHMPDHDELDLDSIDEFVDEVDAKQRAKSRENEKADRGPASHTVIVRFGDGDSAFDKEFVSLSEVGTLQLAYAITCHKMQGGECPTVIIVVHESHSRSLNREWLYTAITRASQNCILLYTDRGIRIALNRQAIAGSSLREKILSFQTIIGKVEDEDGNPLIRLPRSDSPYPTILEQDIASDAKSRDTERRIMAGSGPSGLSKLVAKHAKSESAPPPPPPPSSGGPNINIKVTHQVKVTVSVKAPPAESAVPESGPDIPDAEYSEAPAQLTPARIAVPQYGAAHMLVVMREAARLSQLALPAPAPEPNPEPAPKAGLTLGQLFKRSGNAQ